MYSRHTVKVQAPRLQPHPAHWTHTLHSHAQLVTRSAGGMGGWGGGRRDSAASRRSSRSSFGGTDTTGHLLDMDVDEPLEPLDFQVTPCSGCPCCGLGRAAGISSACLSRHRTCRLVAHAQQVPCTAVVRLLLASMHLV